VCAWEGNKKRESEDETAREKRERQGGETAMLNIACTMDALVYLCLSVCVTEKGRGREKT